ncbi:tetratricopeptide repeat protein [Luteimonas sp. 3794]|uniref:YfgM family protein n=1 Tax=Luteimonas sp. 3794 TaxID=2817730 RepID=UPI002859C77E|nr:tetratricopeptide repeat protein [Luteimonas sp. 3794]MDR6990808.1 putative negative regulator of RcsB-dependent stress response [Luteimonas sp. 3794]
MAIDELLDEREQGERVKAWLRDNGLGLVGGLVLGAALIGGWQYWKNRTYTQAVEQHAAYQSALLDIRAGEFEKASQTVSALPDTAYGELAALQLAKAQVDKGDHEAAIATLEAVEGAEPGVAAVVQQRLARLLTDAGRGEDAVKVLADAEDAVSLEARGDAHFALKQNEQARADYAQALRQLDSAAQQRGLLELKLSEVGGTPDEPEVES